MTVKEFIEESNKIEGIVRPPTQEEIDEFNRFMELKTVTVRELEQFVSVYEPEAKIRDKPGMNVSVGRYTPPFGGPEIPIKLHNLLFSGMRAFEQHIAYERLHPFDDCNGRSGRMLWAWTMGKSAALSLGFLHCWYYQTLR